MTLERSPKDTLAPLPEELARAVEGLRAFVEPTPQQLDASYQRVHAALAGLPLAAPEVPAPPPAPRVAPDAAAHTANSLAMRRGLWLVSGGITAVALAAGFAIGRWSSYAPSSAGRALVTEAASVAPPAVLASAMLEPAVSPPIPAAIPARAAQPEAQSGADSSSSPPAASAPVAEDATAEQGRTREQPAPRSAVVSRGSTTSGALPRPVAARRADSGDLLCPARDPLLRAECLLRRQEPERALAALHGASASDRRERERVLGLTLLARCQLGQEVRSLGKQFFAEWPESSLRWRIRNECPSAEPGVDGVLQRAAARPGLAR